MQPQNKDERWLRWGMVYLSPVGKGVKSTHLKGLELEGNWVMFRDCDFPDAFLVGFVDIRVVRTGQVTLFFCYFTSTDCCNRNITYHKILHLTPWGHSTLWPLILVLNNDVMDQMKINQAWKVWFMTLWNRRRTKGRAVINQTYIQWISMRNCRIPCLHTWRRILDGWSDLKCGTGSTFDSRMKPKWLGGALIRNNALDKHHHLHHQHHWYHLHYLLPNRGECNQWPSLISK